jgi:hypothetical protein
MIQTQANSKEFINPDQFSTYLIVLLLYPLFFLLHGVNENFGLIPFRNVAELGLIYLSITAAVALLSKWTFGNNRRALVYSFVVLSFCFFFGALKDAADSIHVLETIARYKYLLPLCLLAFLALLVYLRKTANSFRRLTRLISIFVVIIFLIELAHFSFNIVTNKQRRQDFGDLNHSVIKHIGLSSTGTKPDIFWIVMDGYPANSTTRKVWNFNNPIDSILSSKGFFVADSATSNYNYTHYSIASTLDMVYLDALKNHSVVRYRDIAKGHYSLFNNNVLKLLEKQDYSIKNYAIYNVENYPTGGKLFDYEAQDLINFQTFWGRVRGDIGWNFINIFSKDKVKADSLFQIRQLDQTDSMHDAQLKKTIYAVEEGSTSVSPQFFMLHYMLPHEPFIYNADGSIRYEQGFNFDPANFIPHLQYTNSVVDSLLNAIFTNYANRNIVIVIQGDHGYKFDEDDPLFDEESCKILYGVYCSDKNYSGWYKSLSSVNSFRLIFNKYFHTGLDLLPDSSYNLYYR